MMLFLSHFGNIQLAGLAGLIPNRHSQIRRFAHSRRLKHQEDMRNGHSRAAQELQKVQEELQREVAEREAVIKSLEERVAVGDAEGVALRAEMDAERDAR